MPPVPADLLRSLRLPGRQRRRRAAPSHVAPRRVRDGAMHPFVLATWVLCLYAVLLVGASLTLFIRIVATDKSIIASVREDAMWATYQADRHAHALKWEVDAAVLTRDPGHFPQIVTAFDILYSRATLLETGAFSIDLTDESGIGGTSARGAQMIFDLARTIDALDPADPDLIGRLRDIQPVTDEIATLMADLTLRSNAALSALRVQEREKERRSFIQLGIAMGLIVIVFLAIAALLAVQLRHNSLANRRMSLLRERSRRQALRARRANAAKSTFLATMSHEIRTPLNGILGMAESLSLGALSPGQQRQVGVIRTACSLLLDVINDILDFSRLESGKVKLNLEAVELPMIADTLLAVLAPAADKKNLHLRIDLPRGRVVTDPGRLRQITLNLTGNAIKFTDHGSVTVTGSLCGEGRLRVEVRDTGVGIAPENLPLLFRNFSQVDGSFTRRYGGTGLGLAICKRLTEGMGGLIGVESVPGQGSLFWFEIPVSPAPESSETDTADAAMTAPGSFRGRVLVAEDNAINREVLTGLLQHLGLEVETAEDGQAAVEAVARRSYDIVLMDMQMPRKSGTEATEEIRQSGNPVPIAGVTANAFTSNRRDCERAGMNDFLSKPVTLDQLAALLLRQGVARNDADPAPADPAAALAPVLPAPPGTDAPPPAPPSDQLQALAAVMGAETVSRLLIRFAADLDTTEAALAAAAAAGDSAALDRHLHAFKGAAGTLGFVALAAQGQALRDRGTPEPAAFRQLMASARQAVAAARV